MQRDRFGYIIPELFPSEKLSHVAPYFVASDCELRCQPGSKPIVLGRSMAEKNKATFEYRRGHGLGLEAIETLLPA